MALNIELDSPEEAKRVFAAAIAAGATEATELKLHFWQSEGEWRAVVLGRRGGAPCRAQWPAWSPPVTGRGFSAPSLASATPRRLAVRCRSRPLGLPLDNRLRERGAAEEVRGQPRQADRGSSRSRGEAGGPRLRDERLPLARRGWGLACMGGAHTRASESAWATRVACHSAHAPCCPLRLNRGETRQGKLERSAKPVCRAAAGYLKRHAAASGPLRPQARRGVRKGAPVPRDAGSAVREEGPAPAERRAGASERGDVALRRQSDRFAADRSRGSPRAHLFASEGPPQLPGGNSLGQPSVP